MNKLRTALGILGLAFVLAACGSNSDAPDPDPEPEPDSFTVSGTVLDTDDNPLEDVTINFSDTSDTATTDSDGNWESPELKGEVTVTPEHNDYDFTPEKLKVDAEAADVDFTGTANGSPEP
ncbi:MAG TPA: carboxypeptidase-like regulatory domain-containing protein, partial [Deinococcales bacterium]|nr:carboxypeptidase-like regulatory domain-containing protein [Deinococcales bacterium]